MVLRSSLPLQYRTSWLTRVLAHAVGVGTGPGTHWNMMKQTVKSGSRRDAG